MNTSLRRVTKRIPPGKQAEVYIDDKVGVMLFAPKCVYLDVTFAYPSTSADKRVLLEVHEFQRNPFERRRRLSIHHYGAVRRIFAAHPEQLGELLNTETVQADTPLPPDLEAMVFDNPANLPGNLEFGHEPPTRSFRPTVELRRSLSEDTEAEVRVRISESTGIARIVYLRASSFIPTDEAEAKRHFALAAKLDEKYFTSDLEEGKKSLTAGDYDLALASLQRAYYINNAPGNPRRTEISELLTNVGVAYKKGDGVKKNNGKAKAAFRLAAWCNPQNYHAQYHRGTIYFEERNYTGAKENLLGALAHAPKHSSAHFVLGRTYEALGRHMEAQQEYRTAAELGNTDAMKKLQPK